MKGFSSRSILAILVAACIVTGCIDSFREHEKEKNFVLVEEYPGVCLTNDLTALPLATSGHDVYVIGELHGTREIHLLFVTYLKMLHETCGLRDVIMEVNQHAEEEANAYAVGELEEFPATIWNRPDRFDVLEYIREMNEGLPDKGKIRVHLVDLDIAPQGVEPYTYFYMHLVELREELKAESINIPPVQEFAQWDETEMLEVVEALEKETEDEKVLNELRTVRTSIKFKSGQNDFDLREEAIAQNIQNVLKEVDRAPLLALYGRYHSFKVRGTYSWGDPWVDRLRDSGTSVYSVSVTAASGEYWLDYHVFDAGAEGFYMDDVLLEKDTPLKALFDIWADYEIAYVDLHTITYLVVPWQASGHCPLECGTSLSEAFDGIVLFKEVSPSRTS
ncbi:MAG: hypothetical protein HXS52_08510 [Theionarchaea archaeon]|nr:hypothetical protein [Theionarchaea archaeon]MBU7037960.1 hypothetical protein [Theionarchaea archaeon]